MDIKDKTIIFLGDSITQGVGASKDEFIYHRVLKRQYNLKEALNFGISGTRFARQYRPSENPEFDLDFCSRIDTLPETADMVVVFGGTNDFGHGDAPLGKFSDRSVTTFYGACHYLMKNLIIKYPDKPIIFMTPLHRADEESLCKQQNTSSLREYVNAIKETAEYYSVPVLDLYGSSGMQPMIDAQQQLYFQDEVHPNDNGHMRIAHLLGKYIESI